MSLLSLFIESSFRVVESDRIIVGYVDLLFLADYCIQMACKDVTKASSHNNNVIFI